MPNTWFGRFAIFVGVLLALRLFFRWNISIMGSILVTLIVYVIVSVLAKD